MLMAASATSAWNRGGQRGDYGKVMPSAKPMPLLPAPDTGELTSSISKAYGITKGIFYAGDGQSKGLVRSPPTP